MTSKTRAKPCSLYRNILPSHDQKQDDTPCPHSKKRHQSCPPFQTPEVSCPTPSLPFNAYSATLYPSICGSYLVAACPPRPLAAVADRNTRVGGIRARFGSKTPKRPRNRTPAKRVEPAASPTSSPWWCHCDFRHCGLLTPLLGGRNLGTPRAGPASAPAGHTPSRGSAHWCVLMSPTAIEAHIGWKIGRQMLRPAATLADGRASSR